MYVNVFRTVLTKRIKLRIKCFLIHYNVFDNSNYYILLLFLSPTDSSYPRIINQFQRTSGRGGGCSLSATTSCDSRREKYRNEIPGRFTARRFRSPKIMPGIDKRRSLRATVDESKKKKKTLATINFGDRRFVCFPTVSAWSHGTQTDRVDRSRLISHPPVGGGGGGFTSDDDERVHVILNSTLVRDAIVLISRENGFSANTQRRNKNNQNYTPECHGRLSFRSKTHASEEQIRRINGLSFTAIVIESTVDGDEFLKFLNSSFFHHATRAYLLEPPMSFGTEHASFRLFS